MITGCFFVGNIAASPELYINESEAKEVADALVELSKHYPIGMSEKAIAWVNFSFAVGGVFGPKVVAVMKRPRKPGPGRVVNMVNIRQPEADASTSGAAAPVVPSDAWIEPDTETE